MRILVVSDTHGRIDNVVSYIKENTVDAMIHLGDCVEDAQKIQDITGVDSYYVRGNCDFYDVSTPEDLILSFGDKTIFCTHGHKYSVKRTKSLLKEKANSVQVKIILFGHTHVLEIEEKDGIIYMNPGSSHLPRSSKGETVGILEIEEDSFYYYFERL